MKTNIKTTERRIPDSGYCPNIQIKTNSYSNKYFHDSSASKNTTAEIFKNKTITIPATIKG